MSDVIKVSVKVVPGASRNRVVGRYGEGIKVQVSAAPEKGKANDAVIAVLAAFFGIDRGSVELTAGHGNPRKQFRLHGLSPDVFATKLSGLK